MRLFNQINNLSERGLDYSRDILQLVIDALFRIPKCNIGSPLMLCVGDPRFSAAIDGRHLQELLLNWLRAIFQSVVEHSNRFFLLLCSDDRPSKQEHASDMSRQVTSRLAHMPGTYRFASIRGMTVDT